MSKKKKRVNQTHPSKAQDSAGVIEATVKARDTYSNPLANLGIGSNNLSETGFYPLTRFTWDYQTLNSLYRNNWIAKAIVDKPAQEMMKNGFEIHSEMDPDSITKIEVAFKRTMTKDRFLNLIKWSRLYGGSVLIPLIEGQENLEEPLEYDEIPINGYKGCFVVDRWCGVSPSLEVVTDIESPEFGDPKYYIITDNTTKKTMRVHHTRVIRMIGRELPYWEQMAEMYWGASELEHVFTELRKRDDTSANIAFLIFLANIRIFKMQDLGQAISLGDQRALEQVYNTARNQNRLMCNTGTMLMDKDDDFEMHQYTFAGINEIYESFMLDISGAAEIPVTKLFGRSPAGFNSTGEGDLQNYYDMIQEKQENVVRYPLEKLLKIITVSEVGKIPDDWDLVFNPIRRPSEDEKAQLAQNLSAPIFTAFENGIIDKATALKELKQQQKQASLWSNITDEMIKEAEKEAEEQKKQQEEEQRELEQAADQIDRGEDQQTGPSERKEKLPVEKGQGNNSALRGRR